MAAAAGIIPITTTPTPLPGNSDGTIGSYEGKWKVEKVFPEIQTGQPDFSQELTIDMFEVA